MLTPKQGTLERLLLDTMREKGEVTAFDFVGTGITEENIDQLVSNLRTGMFISENDCNLKVDA